MSGEATDVVASGTALGQLYGCLTGWRLTSVRKTSCLAPDRMAQAPRVHVSLELAHLRHWLLVVSWAVKDCAESACWRHTGYCGYDFFNENVVFCFVFDFPTIISGERSADREWRNNLKSISASWTVCCSFTIGR